MNAPRVLFVKAMITEQQVSDQSFEVALMQQRKKIASLDFDNPSDWHGHVRPRPDGSRARCGSVRMCAYCQEEARRLAERGTPVDLESTPVRCDEPTPAQARARRYPKRAMPWKGLTIRIENETGSVRRGNKPDGGTWETRMAFPYGEIARTEGVDGDPVDVFVGPFAETAETVFVIHQRRVDDWKKFDEDKCMIGFLSEADAREAFLQCYDDPRFLGPITAIPVAEFVEKVKATREAPAMIKAAPSAAGEQLSLFDLLGESDVDKNPILFVKSHVSAYTKKDGTFVAAHEDNRRKHDDAQHGIAWKGEDAADAIRDYMETDPYATFGLRVIPHGFDVSVGDDLPPSKRWEDGEDTGDELDGVSTIGVTKGTVENAIKQLERGGYSGNQIALVAGDSAGFGEDEGERLIRDAKVIACWSKVKPMTKSILFLKARDLSDTRTVDMFAGGAGAAGHTHMETITRKDGVVQRHVVADAGADTVTEPRADLIAEHKRLVSVLESPSHEDDKQEAKKQAEELKELEWAKAHDSPKNNDLDNSESPFEIDLGFMGKHLFKASGKPKLEPGEVLVSSRILVSKAKQKKYDQDAYGLPKEVLAWRINVVRGEKGIHGYAEYMGDNYGRHESGEIVAYFEQIKGHAADALERIGPSAYRELMKDYNKAKVDELDGGGLFAKSYQPAPRVTSVRRIA